MVKLKKKGGTTTKSRLAIPRAQILRVDMEFPIKQLSPYHKNARKGDPEKVAESLHENGQFKPIVVNIGGLTGRPNEILAGNHTYLGARRLGWKTMACAFVDVDEDRARAIVLADNAAGDNSSYDEALLTELLVEQSESVGTLVGTVFTDEMLGKLVKKNVEDPKADVDRIEDMSDEMEGIADFNNNVIFDSNAPYEIPELRADMLLETLPPKLEVWAGHELDLPRQEAEPDRWWMTQWHAGCRGVNWKQAIPYFYAPDAHFESVFQDPSTNTKKILNLGCKAVIMPNYSIIHDWPSATWVWAIYRSFYCGRFFQEAGLKVIPDIHPGPSEEILNLNLPQIPHGAPIVATQIQNANKDNSYLRTAARVLREAEERLDFGTILVYGHHDADEVVKRAGFKSAEVVRIESRSARRRDYLNSGATINTQKVSKGRKKK